MRSTTFFVSFFVVAVAVALVAVRHGTEAQPAESPGTVTLIGDSLNVGVEPYLGEALPGWRVVADDQAGRTTPEGIAELAAGRPALSSYVVVSLGTNDGHDVAAFQANVARVIELAGPDRCVIWATVWRDGKPSVDFNDVLRDAAEANKRLRLVAWAEMVDKQPELLAGDGLHGNEAGYRERAEAVAEAMRSCAPGPSLAPPQ
jgi:lysophospholipase L1-like esterase